jgi:hypothetical protein
MNYILTLFGYIFSIPDKPRLIIEYLLIIAIIALGVFCFNLWQKNNSMENRFIMAETKIHVLERTNNDYLDEIVKLHEVNDDTTKVLSDLMHDYKLLAKLDSVEKEKLKKLADENQHVKDFLAMSIPYDVNCLLTNSCN